MSISRRTFVANSGIVAGAAATLGASAPGANTAGTVAAREYRVRTTVNGCVHEASIDPRTTLLDWLRESLDLTGAKKGCNRGECGACTVHLEGRRVNACLVLAASVDGKNVTTIEGLAGADGALHPMQQAFLDHDGFQCGYCTPGQIMSAVACVAEGHATNDAEIREWMSGNLCRCSAYPQIVDSVRAGARRG